MNTSSKSISPVTFETTATPTNASPILSAIPEVDLEAHVQNELSSIDRLTSQQKKEELAFEIAKSYYQFHKIFPSDVSTIINAAPQKEKNKILDNILSIYINNSNSLNCSDYSLYVNGLMQQFSEPSSLQKALEPLSPELKSEVKLLIFKAMVGSVSEHLDYRNKFTKEEYFSLLDDPEKFYKEEKDYRSKHQTLGYKKKYMSSYDSRDNYNGYSDYLEAVYANAVLVNFNANNQIRIELINSIVSNLSEELKQYIQTNPGKFKEKVAALHKKINSPTPQLNINSHEGLNSQTQSDTAPNAASSFLGSFIKMISFWNTSEPARPAEAQNTNPLTLEEKFKQEIINSSNIAQKLKFSLISTTSMQEAFDAIRANCSASQTALDGLEANSFNPLFLEEARVMGRNLKDLEQAFAQALKLPSEKQKEILPGLDKIVQDTLGMSQALNTEIDSQKSESIIKSIQVTERLSNIRAQSQNNQAHMKLGK